MPIRDFNSLLCVILYFAGIMIVVCPLIYLSAKTQAKATNFDAIVEFNENEIKINHNNKDEIETKDWSWIKKIDIKAERVWLTINELRPFAISLPKSKLSDVEINFFEQIVKMKYDH